MKIDTVPSTATRLTGTGIPGATIKVKVAGRELPNTVTVGQNGRWELQLTKGLNSNQTNQRQLVPSDPVVVTQIVGGVESSEKSVPVSLGETSIQPSVEGGTTVYAGAKNIVVKAPHDAGMIYVSYRDKDTGAEHEIGLKRENIDSPWVSNKSNLGVVTGTTKDAFTNTITIKMNESIAEGTAKAVSNISEGNYSSAVDWKTIPVSNQAPTITAGSQGSTVTVEHGAPVTLKNLVTARDVEDDSQITRGNGVNIEVISVNDSTTTKEINTNQPGVYRVKYKAVDSQGKESSELTITVKVREDKPTKPEATAPSDGTVTVTPTGEADKVTVTYTDEKNAQKTVTVVKAKDGTWSSPEKPEGVTVNPTTGALLIPAEGVRDRSQVTATATKGDSRPSDPTIVTAQPKDFTPVKPDEKVPAKDKDHLTPEEKKQVEDKVKAKNPGKEVTVGEDGTTTVTDPTTGISHDIPGTDLVNQDFTPVKPDEKVPAKDKDHLTPEEKKQVEDKVKAKNPGKEVTVGEDGTTTVTDPTTGISHDIPGTDLVNQDFTPVKPPIVEVPEYTNPVGTSSTDGEGNVITPPTVEIPAYTDPVTPITPDTNGGSGQDTPAPTPATPTPNSVTPNADQVDTKTTVDNGAKSNDSQNVLPNTGTESNATLASLGLLGLLSGFGLVARKKKED